MNVPKLSILDRNICFLYPLLPSQQIKILLEFAESQVNTPSCLKPLFYFQLFFELQVYNWILQIHLQHLSCDWGL